MMQDPAGPERKGKIRSRSACASHRRADLPRRRFVMHLCLFFLAALGLVFAPTPGAADERDLWAGLRAGTHVALLRHALAPGTGDPASFTLGDCTTQRNLSEEGRAQARRIGARFRTNGIGSAAVFTSQWCRCRDTAALLGLGPVEDLPLLNSFFQNRGNREAQTNGLAAWLAARPPGAPLVLVTHQVNITALTGVFPASGEMVILRRDNSGRFALAGTMETD